MQNTPPPTPWKTPSQPTDAVTWAALLGGWTAFAKATAAVRDTPNTKAQNAPAGAWKASAAPVIGLQAVTLALRDADTLEPDERAAAADRAEILVRRHAGELHDAWRGWPMPEGLTELLDDAAGALRDTATHGTAWIVDCQYSTTPDAEPIVQRLLGTGCKSDLYAAPEGTRLGYGAPALFCAPDLGTPAPDGFCAVRTAPVQVYRNVSAQSAVDTVAPLAGVLPAGTPLLRPRIIAGERVRVHAPAVPKTDGAAQRVEFVGFAIHNENTV